MKTFTITHGQIENFIQPIIYTATSGSQYPVIAVGENHRGSKYSFVPVSNSSFIDGKPNPIYSADISATKSGKPLIIDSGGTEEMSGDALIVFLTPIGFRGSNNHFGKFLGYEKYVDYGIEREIAKYSEFPGQILAEGVISQGTAGRMGSGEQIIAIIQKGVEFGTALGGRLYGKTKRYFYKFDGQKILVWNEQEIDLIDLIE